MISLLNHTDCHIKPAVVLNYSSTSRDLYWVNRVEVLHQNYIPKITDRAENISNSHRTLSPSGLTKLTRNIISVLVKVSIGYGSTYHRIFVGSGSIKL